MPVFLGNSLAFKIRAGGWLYINIMLRYLGRRSFVGDIRKHCRCFWFPGGRKGALPPGALTVKLNHPSTLRPLFCYVLEGVIWRREACVRWVI